MGKVNVLVALPCYNEKDNLLPLIGSISRVVSQKIDHINILVVDDGSHDGSKDLLQSLVESNDKIDLIDVKKNRGLGPTVKTIFTYDHLYDYDYMVIMDADNTQDPKLIPVMIDQAMDLDLDIVIASRFVDGGRVVGVPALRRLTSWGASVFCRLTIHIQGVKDYSCGYRLYNTSYIKHMNFIYQDRVIDHKGFECMVEILAKSKKLACKVGEVPMVLRYDYKNGSSKMRVVKTLLGYVSVWFDHIKIKALR